MIIKNINKEIIDSTECDKSFKCINNQDYLCEVNCCIDNKVIFLKCNDRKCKFKTAFGDDFFCSCPVRLEIYKRHKL